MLDAWNFTDSSDDNNNMGAITITVESEFEDEMEINPYWTKVKVDKLQRIGNPTKILPFGEDLMANLENITMFNDKEIAELAWLTTLLMELSLEDTDSMPDL